MLMTREPVARRQGTALESLSVQLLLGLIGSVVLPGLFFTEYLGADDRTAQGVEYSLLCSIVAVILGTLLFRRVTAFPGTRSFSYVLPSFATSYGLVIATMFAARLEYNRPLLFSSIAAAIVIALLSSAQLARYGRRRFHLVPFGRVDLVDDAPGVDWIVMDAPEVPADRNAVIVADLKFDHDREWERMLANAAIRGHVVYHTKQLRESLTGRVSIDHLSENSFGSLVPNLAYRKVKRVIDLLSSIVLLPLLALPLALVALAIKLDSRGPVLFSQERMGYRGRTFRMVKFRTMRPCDEADERSARSNAMTADNDNRVTRVGRFLRRTRLDELPQIVNIIRGEMSWIGPRPEALALSHWYESEIPFYSYRHIVRPGITGWAQVNQGHVTDLAAVNAKLSYDFYYIKNFSSWLDVLIALRTMRTIVSGFGAR